MQIVTTLRKCIERMKQKDFKRPKNGIEETMIALLFSAIVHLFVGNETLLQLHFFATNRVENQFEQSL
jgi:hypothetical protein